MNLRRVLQLDVPADSLTMYRTHEFGDWWYVIASKGRRLYSSKSEFKTRGVFNFLSHRLQDQGETSRRHVAS